MSYKSGKDPLTEFERWALKMPRAELGGLIKEYFGESNHTGWDCWGRRDLTGIRKFCEDVMRYHHHSDPEDLATGINNVNPVK